MEDVLKLNIYVGWADIGDKGANILAAGLSEMPQLLVLELDLR
jgi:hypothetical protein